jgi:hypothetical protein
MSYIINLDEFKPFFMECVTKMNVEVGFSLFFNPKKTSGSVNGSKIASDIRLQTSIGLIGYNNETVTDRKTNIYYDSVAKIVTNPSEYMSGLNLNPPDESDYILSISDYYRGTQVSIKIEQRGIWVWKPNVELIDLINNVMPEYVQTMKEFTPDKSFEDYHPKLETYNEALQSLFKTIVNNIYFYNIYVSMDAKLVALEYPTVYDGYKKITTDEYCKYMNNVINDKETAYGFDVSFITWDTPLNINLYYNEYSSQILRNMEKRKLHVWKADDKDLIIKRIKKMKKAGIVMKEDKEEE